MKIKFILILFILTTSCKSQKKDLIEFDPTTLDGNKITLSEIADDISYIPLDNSFPLGQVHPNYKFVKNSIYFTVTFTGILEFNRDGKFIRKIGNIGRGPGEYTFYIHFSVDDEKGLIYVLDDVSKRSAIKVYSGTGEFVKGISLKGFGDNIDTFEYFNSKLFVFNSLSFGDSKYNWIICDTSGNIIKRKERTTPMFMSGWSGSFGTYKLDNNLFYWDMYNDTVFSIFPDLRYKASFILSPGEHRAPRAHIPNPFLLKQYMLINQIFETRHFLAIIFYYKRPVFVLIDKKTRESFLYYLEIEGTGMGTHRIGGIVNDLDGGPMFLPQNYFEENSREYMVGLIYPYKIKNRVASVEFKNTVPKYPEKKKDLEKLANSLKETDNPILMMVRLKK